MAVQNLSDNKIVEPKPKYPWVWTIILLGILIIGAYFRLVGIDWDQENHLHPDERFMTMVASSVSIPKDISEYFNTDQSSLNPHNRGYGFYVYGTLPLTLVRLVSETIDKTGYGEIYLVGRYLSGFVDLLTVLLVYLIALKLYRKIRLALLAAAFSAFAVMQIQLSHYFTVDTYTNFFTFLAFYFCILILTRDITSDHSISADDPDRSPLRWSWLYQDKKAILPFLLFGIALGMAMASKVSAAPLALILPAAVLVKYSLVPHSQRRRQAVISLRNLILAAIFAFLVFRICQPYAFNGPGFFGIGLNQKWVDNLKDLSQQSGGDVDFPPALQWARRPVTFALENMVLWGLGLPLGLLSWIGFLWMTWRIYKGEWRSHSIIWGWTLFYFVWQSLNFSSSMRYQLPVYPTLAIIASWCVFTLWEKGKSQKTAWVKAKINWAKISASLIGVIALTGTFAWAFAFTRIYTRPVTRIAASDWIYQNIPAAINFKIDTGDGGVFNQTLPFRAKAQLAEGQPIMMAFTTHQEGILQDIKFEHIVDPQLSNELKTIDVTVSSDREAKNVLTSAILSDPFTRADDPRGADYKLVFDPPYNLIVGQTYYLSIRVETPNSVNLAGTLVLDLQTGGGNVLVPLADPVDVIRPGKDFLFSFNVGRGGSVKEVYIPHMVDWEAGPGDKQLKLTILNAGITYSATLKDGFIPENDPRGKGYSFIFDTPFPVYPSIAYTMRLEIIDGAGSIALYGSRQAIESSWDDPLPYAPKGYNNPFDYETGVYRSELNFEMYWDDNEDKRQRFITNLDEADYIFISSNRQWGTTVRVPERYPMTSVYYRNLLGCPADKDIVWCYRIAQPGMFRGNLGFDLVQVFESDPNLGPIRFNDQFAEEAFTVYDHPKVFIFQKRPDYNPDKISEIFGAVDLTKVVHLTPKQAGSYKGNLLLSSESWAIQQMEGTWSDIFSRDSIQNRYPGIGLVIWYLVISLLGWIVYPSVRFAFRGLKDRGYPITRLAGLLILAFFVWLAGSAGVTFSRMSISSVVLLLIVVNGGLAYLQRQELIDEWKSKKKYFLLIEIITLVFFVYFLLVRLGNPDLWHPYKGGEKPMDFSYFNAILKSTTFPPYDPWFAGGYLNYYYYGFVLAGVLVKWLGIIPSIAYNLILPTWFSFLGIGAFSFGWNLLANRASETDDVGLLSTKISSRPLYAGLASSILLLMVGNLGTVRMIWQGFQKIVAPINIDDGTIIQSWIWAFQGLGRFIGGSSLPYAPGDWYWIPSRAIPGEPITEFPYFTFLYGDPHAHMFALPLTMVALLWGLSIISLRARWDSNVKYGKWLTIVISLLFGGIAIGALRPTNTWDFPTYLTLAVIAILYTLIKYYHFTENSIQSISLRFKRVLPAICTAASLVILSFVLYQPFAFWYGQAYTTVDIWQGDRTPISSYFTHWGLFLFIILSWMTWETRDWLAKTPVSALNKLRPYRMIIQGLLISLVVVVLGLLIWGVSIAWVALPMAFWAAVLIFRPGQPDEKRAVLFMIGTAFVLTLLVEVTTLRGDIGRMNWVFKFYLQAWTLFSISSAGALVWLFSSVKSDWRPFIQKVWQIALFSLLFGAALFTVTATIDKIKDRMTSNAPHTLDGMTYMQYATYNQEEKDMKLVEDYRAITWMQNNVKGSPVIVEANTPEYRWGTRFTIYTGLPGVVGWNWHQRQQRGIVPPEWVTDRVQEIGDFYSSVNIQYVEKFLRKYNVRFVIVGQLEEAIYPPYGLSKFHDWDGKLWKEVYQDGNTHIYEVLQ